jgi:cell migration-inducing and hyaluronan-binding protein
MDEGSWVIFELPGFTTSAGGAEQSSLAALRDASETSFFRDDEALWVKLVVADAGNPEGTGGIGDLGGRTSVTVSRPAPPAQ